MQQEACRLWEKRLPTTHDLRLCCADALGGNFARAALALTALSLDLQFKLVTGHGAGVFAGDLVAVKLTNHSEGNVAAIHFSILDLGVASAAGNCAGQLGAACLHVQF